MFTFATILVSLARHILISKYILVELKNESY